MGMKKTTLNKNNSNSRVSLRKSKHNSTHIEKNKKKNIGLQPLPAINSLIRVLRPKVYITDSSSFKSLVQQLTGNGAATATIPTDPEILIQPSAKESPVVGIGSALGEPGLETVSPSFDGCTSMTGHQRLAFLDENSPCQSDGRSSFNNSQALVHHHHQQQQSGHDPVSEDSSLLDMMSNLFSYQDLESWLIDLGSQEASACDYPLTGPF